MSATSYSARHMKYVKQGRKLTSKPSLIHILKRTQASSVAKMKALKLARWKETLTRQLLIACKKTHNRFPVTQDFGFEDSPGNGGGQLRADMTSVGRGLYRYFVKNGFICEYIPIYRLKSKPYIRTESATKLSTHCGYRLKIHDPTLDAL